MYMKGLPTATAFVVLGLLELFGWTSQPNLAYAWIVAGVAALLAGWVDTMGKK